jgi:hypothetical protein
MFLNTADAGSCDLQKGNMPAEIINSIIILLLPNVDDKYTLFLLIYILGVKCIGLNFIGLGV